MWTWTRTLLKDNAKTCLRTSYWRVFLICLVGTLLTGGLELGTRTNSVSVDYTYSSGFRFGLSGPLNALLTLGGVLLVVVGVLALAVALVWDIFVAPVIRVGWYRAMMENRVGKGPFETLFSGFRAGYWNLVRGSFYANVRIFLYSLLLVVPGIIKSYQYFFVPYLLAENPDMEPARAAELSTLLSDGEKWQMFVLDLSFFGWRLLGSLFFGLGNLFVEPYYQATMAELYAAMRAKAFARGYTDARELGGFVRY